MASYPTRSSGVHELSVVITLMSLATSLCYTDSERRESSVGLSISYFPDVQKIISRSRIRLLTSGVLFRLQGLVILASSEILWDIMTP